MRLSYILRASAVAAAIALFGAQTGPSDAPAPNSNAKFSPLKTLQMLDRRVQRTTALASGGQYNLSAKDRTRVLSLLSTERADLKALIAKYRSKPTQITETQLDTALVDVSRLGAQVGGVILRANRTFKVAESDSPHDCSYNCKEWCGYNTLGEKICYNRCVKCCNRSPGASC
jgi:hypothetical protein